MEEALDKTQASQLKGQSEPTAENITTYESVTKKKKKMIFYVHRALLLINI